MFGLSFDDGEAETCKLLTFDIIPLLDERQSYDGSLEAMSTAISGKPLPATSVLLGLAQSDGRVSVLKFTLTDEDMFGLLRDNADRCSGVDKPNFTNGSLPFLHYKHVTRSAAR